jgi:hypothetical protein
VPFIPQHFTDDIKVPWLAITGDLLPSLSMDIIMLAERVELRSPNLSENSHRG